MPSTPRTSIFRAILLTVLAAAVQTFAANPLLAQAKPPAKAHTHGHAELDIVIEGRTGRIEFRAPAEDVYGFEREPRNAAERTRRDNALATLRTRMGEMVIFDASLGCTIAADEVHAGDDDHAKHDHAHGDGHLAVHGEYTITCARPPAGKDIRFGFTKVFSSIRSVQVQLLSDDRQDGRRIEGDRGTVRP